MPLLFDFGSTNLSTILLEMLYRVPGIIVAISFHECAHAYAAYKCGDPTARNLGRMTLNPLAHFDPIGIVMMLLVRFGWAKPVPINTRNFKNPRKDELIVSLAGVATNLIIAFLTLGVMYILQVFTTVDSVILDNILSSMFFLNLAFLCLTCCLSPRWMDTMCSNAFWAALRAAPPVSSFSIILSVMALLF